MDIPEEPVLTRVGETRYLHTLKIGLYDDSCAATPRPGISMDITGSRRAAAGVSKLLSHAAKFSPAHGEVAVMLQQRLRKTAHVGRWGGEAFAVSLADYDAGQACELLDELRKKFEALSFRGDGGISAPRRASASSRAGRCDRPRQRGLVACQVRGTQPARPRRCPGSRACRSLRLIRAAGGRASPVLTDAP